MGANGELGSWLLALGFWLCRYLLDFESLLLECLGFFRTTANPYDASGNFDFL
jgi:hypothetical protein